MLELFIGDLLFVYRWYFVWVIFGIVGFPLSYWFFKNSWGKGYGFSKSISLLFISYWSFLWGNVGVGDWREIGLFCGATTWIVINFLIFQKFKESITKFVKKCWKRLLIIEVIFLFVSLFWTILKGFYPDINNMEKFMDYGFINSVLRSENFPIEDIWQSGKEINYYYFGHVMSSVVILLSKVGSAVGFNLMLPSIVGVVAVGTVEMVMNFVWKIFNIKLVVLSVLFSLFALIFRGNLFVGLYYVHRYLGMDTSFFANGNIIDFADSRNFINGVISEFPNYSFVVGDLHAYVLNLPVVILFLGFMTIKFLENKFNLTELMFMGSLLGVMILTNSWDFVFYFGLFSIILFVNTVQFIVLPKNLFKNAKKYVYKLLVVLIIALVVGLPFLLTYNSNFWGIGLVSDYSGFTSLLIQWGFDLFLATLFIFMFFKNGKKSHKDILIFIIFVYTLIVIIATEIFYVRLIDPKYFVPDYRSNTVFKNWYQVWILLSLVSGIVLLKLFHYYNSRKLIFCVVFGSFLSVLFFPEAIKGFYVIDGEFKYRGLNGETWMSQNFNDDYNAIYWLKDQAKGVLVESVGNSYSDFGRVSSYTGFPTVQGWLFHEWHWRGGDPEIYEQRKKDVEVIYTSADVELVKNLLEKYKVEYVFWGSLEQKLFGIEYGLGLRSLGEIAFASNNVAVVKILL